MTEETSQNQDTQAPVLDDTTPQKFYFHLVLADVVFETKRGGITSHRTQFMTQSVVDEFTAARIHQLQNSAAATVRQKLTARQADGFTVHDVLFLHIHPCGLLTNAEFYGPGQTAELVEKEGTVDTTSGTEETPVAAGETKGGDNVVVPFDRKD